MNSKIMTMLAVLAHIGVFVSCSPEPSLPPSLTFVENGQNDLNVLAGSGVVAADLNGDGNLDALVVNADCPDGQGQRVYFGDGHGLFADSGQQLSSAGKGVIPAIGDVDGNGTPDALVGKTVWLNDGSGTFTAHPELIQTAETGEFMTDKLADLDGDGDLDLFVFVWNDAASSGCCQVYRNDGSGLYKDTSQRFGQEVMYSVALGDFNGDAAVDAVTAGWREIGTYAPNRLWLNNESGYFQDGGQILYGGTDHVHGVASGDLNGDGSLDIVLGMCAGDRVGQVYVNDGHGIFGFRQTLTGSTWAQDVALGDFNGDGNLDVFVLCGMTPDSPSSVVWTGDGQGAFSDSRARLANNAVGHGAALGDFNEDGRVDIFATYALYSDDGTGNYTIHGSPAKVWLNMTPPLE